MNILVLNGSPREEKSISLSLSRQFLEGFQSHRAQLGEAPASVQEVHLVKADVQSCRGCFACWRNEGQCVIKDDMVELFPAFQRADLVIWSMPLYHFGMPALVKNFVERTLPEMQGNIISDGAGGFTHPPRSSAKVLHRNLLVSTCGFPSVRNNYEALHVHLDQLLGRGQWDKIECVQAELLKVPELQNLAESYFEKVRRAGEEWAQGLAGKEAWSGFSPVLREQLDTPLMETERFLLLANASWGVPSPEEAENLNDEQKARILLTQMSHMYNTTKAPSQETILEMAFQDLGRSFFLVMTPKSCRLVDDSESLNAHCTITTDFATWAAISRGELDGTEALMSGRYKAKGDTSLMIRMGDGLFDGGAVPADITKEAKGLPLFLGILPWLITWILLPMGQVLHHNLVLLLALVVANGVLWLSGRHNKPTWYERSNPLLLGLILGASLVFPKLIPGVGVVLMYLVASAQWALSTLKNPLTSDYSRRNYSPAIVATPLFRRTNLIMTFFWGGNYLLIALAILVLNRTSLQPFSGLIVQVALIPAMVFTRWFPRWYSEKRMAGG